MPDLPVKCAKVCSKSVVILRFRGATISKTGKTTVPIKVKPSPSKGILLLTPGLV